MSERFPWRTMADAPRDGTVFLHLAITTICGGPTRPIDIEPRLGLFRRTGTHCGYWVHTNHRGDHQGSLGDDHLTYGHWMAPSTFETWLARSPHWFTMPDGPVVLFRRDSDSELLRGFYSAASAWRVPGGVATTNRYPKPCAVGYLEGNGINGFDLPYRWATVEDFVPPRVEWPAPWDYRYEEIMRRRAVEAAARTEDGHDGGDEDRR